MITIGAAIPAYADFHLSPLVATACGPGTYGEWPRCMPAAGNPDEGIENPDSSDPVEDTNPPPPEPQCPNDGDAALASDEVRRGIRSLYGKSDPNNSLFNRKEQAGWVVKTATGYRIHDWNIDASYNGCGPDIVLTAEDWPPEGPGAIVGFVHTHPYQEGEIIYDCNGYPRPYEGVPSKEDREASKYLGQTVLKRTFPLRGYIIDKSGIRRFVGDATLDPVERCGY